MGIIPRPRINDMIRKLPQQIARLIRPETLLDLETSFKLMVSKESYQQSSTKVIKQALQSSKLAGSVVDLNKIHRRQNLPGSGTPEFLDLFKRVWKIRQPNLRAIRLKVLYKEIFSNERRHRFGIADSPLCVGCRLVETVEQQLFECTNARRAWLMLRDLSVVGIQSFKEVIECKDNMIVEQLLTAIIKALIQIDRSHNMPIKCIAQSCAHFLHINAACSKSQERELMGMIDKLNKVV